MDLAIPAVKDLGLLCRVHLWPLYIVRLRTSPREEGKKGLDLLLEV